MIYGFKTRHYKTQKKNVFVEKYKSELVSRQNCLLHNSNFRSAYKTVVRVAQTLVFWQYFVGFVTFLYSFLFAYGDFCYFDLSVLN